MLQHIRLSDHLRHQHSVWALVWIQVVSLLVQLPASVPEKAAENNSIAWTLGAFINSLPWSSWFRTSAWPSHCYWDHLRSEPRNKSSLFTVPLSLSLPRLSLCLSSLPLSLFLFLFLCLCLSVTLSNKKYLQNRMPTYCHFVRNNPPNGLFTCSILWFTNILGADIRLVVKRLTAHTGGIYIQCLAPAGESSHLLVQIQGDMAQVFVSLAPHARPESSSSSQFWPCPSPNLSHCELVDEDMSMTCQMN